MVDTLTITTQQSLLDFESIKDNFPGITERGADDYSAKGRDLARLIAQLPGFIPLNGTGSPEGTVKSNFSKQYVDTAANQLYFNPVVGADTGWIAL